MLFLDIETNITDGSLVCVGYAIDNGPTQSSSGLNTEVRTRLADPNEVVVTHSGYDVRYLHHFEGALVNAQQHDTQVMAWLVNENTQLDLAWCAANYLGMPLDKSGQKTAGKVPFAQTAAYCEKDVDVTRALYHKLKERLWMDALWPYFEGTEAPFTKVLRDMEGRGLPVDLPSVTPLAATMRAEHDKLAAQLTRGMPSCFNLNSHVHVGQFLASEAFMLDDRIEATLTQADRDLAVLAGVEIAVGDEALIGWEKLPTGTFISTKVGRKWDHGKWVVKGRGKGFNNQLKSVSRPDLMDDPVLSADPWVVEYLKWKKLDKLLSTYLDVFVAKAEHGRIFGRFNQTGTTTGRLSASEPNLQNIPSRGTEGAAIRDLFQGDLVVGDFSQLEPRLMAHFSQDPAMLAAFQQGRDIYDEIAGRVGCTRGIAKTLMLAMSYGAGAEKVASTMRLNGHGGYKTSDARRHLTALQSEFATYFTWREQVILDGSMKGYVETLDGRYRRLVKDKSVGTAAWKDPSRTGRQAANAVVQGSAADVVRRVMLHVSKMFPELRLLAQVHDELVWEYDPATYTPDLQALESWVLRIAGRGLTVPLVFEPHVGTSWYKAKEGIV